MTEHTDQDVTKVLDFARAAEQATRHLCRATLDRPDMSPAEVDLILADLAEAVAALPQVARQLGDILEHADNNRSLQMDTMTGTDDLGLAIAAARRHLEAVSGPALYLYRLLDAAHRKLHTSPSRPAPRTSHPRARRTRSRARGAPRSGSPQRSAATDPDRAPPAVTPGAPGPWSPGAVHNQNDWR